MRPCGNDWPAGAAFDCPMPHPPRLEYPGAVYHLSVRTNRAEPVFADPEAVDHFLEELGAACAKTGWRVHAYGVLPDHAHLVVETPQPNLVLGMKWWLGTFTNRYNRRRGLRGHLFAGRYRAVPVAPEAGFFRDACLHVLLSPARAGLLAADQPLSAYPACSLAVALRPAIERPPWLAVDRLCAACGCPEDSEAGRLAWGQLLEALRNQPEPPHWRALRRGWVFGDAAFRAALMQQMRALAGAGQARRAVPYPAREELGRAVVAEELQRLGWTPEELARRRKGDPEKVRIAQRLRRETTLSLRWIATALHMGSPFTLRNALMAARQASPAVEVLEPAPKAAAAQSPAPRRRRAEAGPAPSAPAPGMDEQPSAPAPTAAEETFNVTWD